MPFGSPTDRPGQRSARMIKIGGMTVAPKIPAPDKSISGLVKRSRRGRTAIRHVGPREDELDCEAGNVKTRTATTKASACGNRSA
jgi:hypothetical protein